MTGWTRGRLRHLVTFDPSKSEIRAWRSDAVASFVPMESVGLDGSLDLSQKRYLGEVYAGYTYFAEGDVLVAKIHPSFENGKGAIAEGLANGVGFGTTELTVLRPRPGVDPRFVRYLVQSKPFTSRGSAWQYGVAGQQRVPAEHFRDFPVSVPPLAEQQRISDILDHELANISTLVRKKEAVVALLSERIEALLEQEIGAADGHPTPVMHLADPTRPIMYGIVLPGEDVDEGVPLIKGGDVYAHRLTPEALARVAYNIERRHSRSRVRPGDLVYGIRGSIGDVAEVPSELGGANMTQDVARISPKNRIDRRWLRYALQAPSTKAQAEERTLGATVKGVNIGALKRFVLPVPDEEEQAGIADRLDAQLGGMEALREKIRVEIGLLRERRVALISAAVSGELDVEGMAA